jgi:hypothetical protein
MHQPVSRSVHAQDNIANVCWSLRPARSISKRYRRSGPPGTEDEVLLLARPVLVHSTTPSRRGGRRPYVVWACVTLVPSAPSLFAALVDHSAPSGSVTKARPMRLPNTAWAALCERSFAAMEQRCDWFVANGNAQAIANTTGAGATLGQPRRPRSSKPLSTDRLG